MWAAQPADSPTADYYFQSASNKRDEGNLGGAIAAFTRVVEIDPSRADAYIQRGKVHLQQRSFDKAIADFTSAIAINPNDPLGYVERGEAQEKRGDREAAMEDFLHFSSLGSGNDADTALRMIIERKKRAGDLHAAIAITTRALAPRLRSIESLCLSRATSKDALGDIGGAIEDLGLAIQAAPDNYNTCEYRARLFYRKAAWQEALDDLIHARPQLHRHGREKVHFHIWVLRMKLGDQAEADRELIAYLEGKRQPVQGEDWMGKIGGFLLGWVPESAFFPMKDPRFEFLRSWPLEAKQSSEWYFIGMKRLFAGDKTGAAECFQKSAPDVQRIGQDEYPFAKAELKALGQ